MKKYATFLISALSVICAAQLRADDKPGDITKVGDTSYLLVRHFTTAAQNETFQRNLSIMQRDAKAIALLKSMIEKEADETKKADLQNKLSQIEEAFKTNDATMQKNYAFASNRSYKFVFIKSNICVPLTKEELSTLRGENGEELDVLKISKKNDASLYRVAEISGIPENEELRRLMGFAVARKADIEKLRAEIAKTTDAEQQLDIMNRLSAAEKAYQEAEANLRKKYGIQEGRNYVVEVEDSKLYLILTPEEVMKIDLEKQASKAK